MTPEKNSGVTRLLRIKMRTESAFSLLHSTGKREYKVMKMIPSLDWEVCKVTIQIETRPLTKGINATTQPGNPKSFLKKNLRINKKICFSVTVFRSRPMGKQCRIPFIVGCRLLMYVDTVCWRQKTGAAVWASFQGEYQQPPN